MTQEISKTIPTEGVEVSRRNLLTRIAPAAGVAAVLGIAASPSLALAKANSPGAKRCCSIMAPLVWPSQEN